MTEETPRFRTDVGDVTGPVHAGRGDIIIQQATPPTPLESEPPAFCVLTVVARPLDQSALPEIGDAWSLVDKLAQVQAPIELAFARPPTVEMLRLRLTEDWDVLHFDGHGIWAWTCLTCGEFIPKEEDQPDPTTCPHCDALLTYPATGYLAFERKDGLTDMLPAIEMATLLCPEGSPPRARLVILTACQSAMGDPSLADVLLEAGVSAVLAMRETVTVGTTVTLLPSFYANLAAGRTLRQALDAALPALRRLGESHISGTSWEEIPVLLGPGTGEPLCEPGCGARTRVERQLLVGVPAPSPSGAFHGDFELADPPGGRKGYLVQLAWALLRGEKLIVLTGVGGIGKSALAAAAGRRLAWRYPGGVFWVDGRDYLETGMRLENVLSIFGHVCDREFDKLPVTRQREMAMDYLRRIQAPALLVVDNADVADERVWRFLRNVPRPSAALVTTRTAPEYGACVLDVRAMTLGEGLTFLAAEIGRRRNDPRWVLGLDGPAARKLLQVARLLDGHALALLQAAGLAGRMGLDHALAQVRDNPVRGELARGFDFSYKPLPEPQKELLHRLAAFAVDFNLEAARAVCKETKGLLAFLRWRKAPPPDLDTGLPDLVRASFVERHNDRFRLHPVTRGYLRRNAGVEAMAAHNRRFVRYFTALASWGRDQLGNPETALQAVQMAMVERANLLTAQDTCLKQELWDEAVSLAYCLNKLFERSGHWTDRRRVLEAGIETARESEKPRDEAGLVLELGMLAQDQGDYAEARDLYVEALDIAQVRGDHAREALSLHQLGMLAQLQENYAEANRLYEESGYLAQQLGDRAGVASSLHQLGVLAYLQGRPAEARRLYEKSLDIAQHLDDPTGVARALHSLGRLEQLQDDYAEACRLYEKSLKIREQLGDRAGVALTLYQLALLEETEGNIPRALELICQAEAIFSELGSRYADRARCDRERLEEKL
jgi:tetratricopeptide (TPR) repeat protein